MELRVELATADLGDIDVSPSVRADHVAGVKGSLELLRIVVNASVVVAVDEEGALCAAAVQLVDERLVVLERTVVKSESDSATGAASVVDASLGSAGSETLERAGLTWKGVGDERDERGGESGEEAGGTHFG